MIPMVNLQAQYEGIRDEIRTGLDSVLEGCQFVMGPNVREFESEVADYLGVGHALGVASGTDALHLALLAAGIEPGDEVITTAFTFIATAEAIRYIGAKPVFVDIDPRTFNITAEAIEQALTPRTSAIVPVHLFGQPVNMQPVLDLARARGLKVVEDCAQSFGARVNNLQTGSLGDCAGFSFFPSKNLGAFGDGGLVTTNSDDLADRVRMFRNHGSGERYYHDVIGYNSRLDEMQAVILRAKLKRIDEYNSNRRRVAENYTRAFENSAVTPPFEDGVGVHVYHQYTILTDRRDAIIAALQEEQIASAVYYPVPLHRQKVFLEDYKETVLPVTEAVSERCMSLPIYPELAETDIQRIAGIVKRVSSD